MEGLDLCVTLCDRPYMADTPLNLFFGKNNGQKSETFLFEHVLRACSSDTFSFGLCRLAHQEGAFLVKADIFLRRNLFGLLTLKQVLSAKYISQVVGRHTVGLKNDVLNLCSPASLVSCPWRWVRNRLVSADFWYHYRVQYLQHWYSG